LRDYEGLKGLPWLVGASRKGLLGGSRTLGSRGRGVGDGCCGDGGGEGGADVVRVHDVEEMAKVVRMAEAIWRV
jgi:2-amino-4-hydroxy-6-hydroxymethyldihydropteridine diphosphokinase/dihydropteroate synthase